MGPPVTTRRALEMADADGLLGGKPVTRLRVEIANRKLNKALRKRALHAPHHPR